MAHSPPGLGKSAPAVALVLGLALFPGLSCNPQVPSPIADVRPPNVVLIVADDLGFGDLGSYGQQVIQTKRLDRMAAEGLRFRRFYAGNTVCAPSRAVMMTGQHAGRVWVRGNASQDLSPQTLRPEDLTVAEVLREAGYTTALFGKWGLGDMRRGGEAGLPDVQGFDRFFGYLNQVHAHNYYPEFLWNFENGERSKVILRNTVVRVDQEYGGFLGGWATEKVDYAHDMIMERALEFLRQQARPPEASDGVGAADKTAPEKSPFFLLLAPTLPHANNEAARKTGNGQEVPDFGLYADRPWTDADKGQAAMITRLDRDVGRLLDLLAELGLDGETVVLFTSDNGHHEEGGQNVELFDPNGPLRGSKRDLYEGGIRVPLIVRWPGFVGAGTVSDRVAYQGDFLNSLAELAGVDEVQGLHSKSLVSEFLSSIEEPASGTSEPHEFLYWEFYERGSSQAVVQGDWKLIRTPMFSEDPADLELYDLKQDLGETNNLAAQHPELASTLVSIMEREHQRNENWQPTGSRP